MKKIALALGAAACLAFLFLAGAIAGAGERLPFSKIKLGAKAKLLQDPSLLSRALLDIAQDPWKPAVNEEKTRGPAAAVYPLVAPAVVVVRTAKGYGTGAFIDREGWVITNHHVIAQGTVDPETGARQATIFWGQLKEGVMELAKDGLPALVYKSSPEKDLALLRIQGREKEKFPHLKLAKKDPVPGQECVAIGHPGSGLLWTVRSGEISGIGKWPRDMTDLLTLNLSASPREREEIKRFLAKEGQRKIVLSNCGINFGDSGGPLVDARGDLIAVTFAMPKKGYQGTAPFAYHVHLEEVRAFLQDRPERPRLLVPDPWPAGIYHELMDLDGDGKPDTLAIANQRGGQPTGMLFDLRQESGVRNQGDLGANPRTAWRFCLAIHTSPALTVFYDTDLDGKVDLILAEKEVRGPIQEWRLDKGRWTSAVSARRVLIDANLYQDASVRERLARIIERIRNRAR